MDLIAKTTLPLLKTSALSSRFQGIDQDVSVAELVEKHNITDLIQPVTVTHARIKRKIEILAALHVKILAPEPRLT
ncbi:MAG: hypothetical protein AAF329_08470 [Cyanobacteria bacterium P01_A01_bin.17]